MVNAMPTPQPRMESMMRLQEFSRISRSLAASYLDHARDTIRAIIAEAQALDRVELQRDGGRYSRTLLFGDAQMSAWAIVWPPGSRTCIHDHHCSCCFGVARGSLKEIWFRAVNDRQAVVHAVALREAGYVAAMLPTGPNIHQMMNDSDQEALSVHIYGFDHTMRTSSIRREYEVLAR